jgi:hypothetical protein
MVKGIDVRCCLLRHRFCNLKNGTDETCRFVVTAKHRVHPVRVKVHASTGFRHHSSNHDKSQVVIQIDGASNRTLPGVDQPHVVSHISELEGVLRDIRSGKYSREAAA